MRPHSEVLGARTARIVFGEYGSTPNHHHRQVRACLHLQSACAGHSHCSLRATTWRPPTTLADGSPVLPGDKQQD